MDGTVSAAPGRLRPSLTHSLRIARHTPVWLSSGSSLHTDATRVPAASSLSNSAYFTNADQ